MHNNLILATLRCNHNVLGLKGTKLYYDVSTAHRDDRQPTYTVKVYQDADRFNFLGTFDLSLFEKVVIKVKCVSIREAFPHQITPGKVYYKDTTSVTDHSNGDKYAMIYHDELCQHLVARLNMNHFEEATE